MSTRNQWFFTVVGLILALFATTPETWTTGFGSWVGVARQVSGPVLIVGLLCVVAVLALRVGRGPYPRGRMPLARTFFDNAGVIRTVNRRDRRGERHRVRVVVATGQTMQGMLRWVIDHFEVKARWEIQILLMDPDSPVIDRASGHWQDEARANLRALADLRAAAARKHGTMSIEWRTFTAPPKVRALAFDDDELFIGFYIWDYHRPDPQMRHQDREHLHLRRGRPGFDYFWEFFESWFAWEWEQGRTLDLGDTELPPDGDERAVRTRP